MLTNLMEGTNTKCSQYWPDASLGSKICGPLTVTLKEEQILLHFVVRNLIVKVKYFKIYIYIYRLTCSRQIHQSSIYFIS